MPPENDGSGAGAPATGDDGKGAKPGPGAEGGTSGPPATGEDQLGDAGKAAIEKERVARREAEAAAKAARDELGRFQRLGMSDLEKAQARVKELEGEAAQRATREQEAVIRVAAVETATTLGFRSPALAWRLIDRSEIKFEDDGTPKNIETLLKEIAKRDPYLVREGQDFGGGSRGKTPDKAPTMDELLRAAARGG